ncbi:hypothetical protein OE88DRAFT_1740537, partial [Heliocybe sulcata]
MSSNIKVWYVLAGYYLEPRLVSFKLSPEDDVDDLKGKIVERAGNQHISLVVYKCVPPLRPDEDSDLPEQVNMAFSKE